MATVVFDQFTLGAPLNGTTLNDDFQLVEDSFSDLGPFVISGLVPSAGTGLTANVTAGVASIGGRVTKSGAWTIVGLADAITNHLYLKNDGTGTSNTTGTQPAGSVKLGTATTAGGVVTSVNVLRSSGRQSLIRPENQVAGDPGSMGSIDLSDWNATAGNGFQVFGTLPAGAVPGTTLAGDVTGSAGANTVVKIRGRAITQPGASEDTWVPRYNHGGTNLAWSKASSIATLGVWGTADISALTTGDVEQPNAWTVGSTLHGVEIPDSGTLEWLSILLPSDIGTAGQNLTATVYKNGVATALTATLNGGAGTETKVLAGTTVSVSQADIITVQAKRVGTPNAVVATYTVYWSCRI